MKPFVRSAKWIRTKLLPKIRKGEPLSWASVWILCSSCSFNNSFQDGCLGHIRITVPPSAIPQKKAQAADKDKASKDGKKQSTHTAQAAEQNPSSANARYWKVVSLDWQKWKEKLRLPAYLQKTSEATPEKRAKPPASRILTRPHRMRWTRSQYRALLPSIWKTMFVQDAEEILTQSLPLAPGTWRLQNTETEELWKERPDTVELCYHTELSNPGWTRYHMPRNTVQKRDYCRSGQTLGTGEHWFLVDDTYATSAMPCRTFFSPGRVYIVAQCGNTIYRTRIRDFATCLQTGQGPHCEYAHATMKKLPIEREPLVEWTAPTFRLESQER